MLSKIEWRFEYIYFVRIKYGFIVKSIIICRKNRKNMQQIFNKKILNWVDGKKKMLYNTLLHVC